jgi:hypothetical protein
MKEKVAFRADHEERDVSPDKAKLKQAALVLEIGIRWPLVLHDMHMICAEKQKDNSIRRMIT